MHSIFDMGLIDAGFTELQLRIGALALHSDQLKKYPITLAWCDEFEASLYQKGALNQELYIAISSLISFLRGNKRIFTSLSCSLTLSIHPDLCCKIDLGCKNAWLGMLGSLLLNQNTLKQGLSILSWHRLSKSDNHLKLTITASSGVHDAPIIFDETNWGRFLAEFHRPDLSGKRIAVLGGERGPTERAKQILIETYKLSEFRWLPPSNVENRSRAETLRQLSTVHLLIVCTDHMGHTEREQLKNNKLSCARIDVHNHSTTTIVNEAVRHFQ